MARQLQFWEGAICELQQGRDCGEEACLQGPWDSGTHSCQSPYGQRCQASSVQQNGASDRRSLRPTETWTDGAWDHAAPGGRLLRLTFGLARPEGSSTRSHSRIQSAVS